MPTRCWCHGSICSTTAARPVSENLQQRLPPAQLPSICHTTWGAQGQPDLQAVCCAPTFHINKATVCGSDLVAGSFCCCCLKCLCSRAQGRSHACAAAAAPPAWQRTGTTPPASVRFLQPLVKLALTAVKPPSFSVHPETLSETAAC